MQYRVWQSGRPAVAGGTDNSAHNEASFTEIHDGGLNAFLKAENLGKESHSQLLVQSLLIQNATFNMSGVRANVAKALIQI